MIINKLDIEGFGVFHDKRVEGLGKGVNILYGKNEAGKSTMLDFIRFTLFDYPTFHKDRRPPIHGGNHGGTIHLQHSKGSNLAVYRSGAKDFSLLLDGEKTDDLGIYNRLTNYASEQLFNNIFAITVDELNDLSKLDESGMKDRIFSMGMGLSNVNLGDIEKKFFEVSQSYFKERGSKQKLAITTHSLDEVESKISDLQANINQYEQLKEEEKQSSEVLKTLEKELKNYVIKKTQLENFQKVYASFSQIQEGENKLVLLKEAITIPKEIVDNVKSDIDFVKRYNEELSDHKNELQLLQNRIDKVATHDELTPHFELIEYLTGNSVKFSDSEAKLKQNEAEKDNLKVAATIKAQGLGEEMTLDQLLALSDYPKLRSLASDFSEKQEVLNRNLQRTIDTYKNLEQEQKEHQLTLEQAESELSNLGWDLETLEKSEIDLTARIEGLKSGKRNNKSTNGTEKILYGAIFALLATLGLVFVEVFVAIGTALLAIVLIIVYLNSRRNKGLLEIPEIDHSTLIKERREIEGQIKRIEELNNTIKDNKARLEQLAKRLKNLDKDQEEINQKLENVTKKWMNLLTENKLPSFIKTDQISDIIAISESVKSDAQRTQSLERENKEIQAFIDDFTARIKPIAKLLDRKPDEIELINNDLRNAKQAHEEHQNLQLKLQEIANKQQSVQDRLDQVEKRLKNFFDQFNAENESDFYEKVKLSEEKLATEELVSQARKQIGIVFGVNEIDSAITSLKKHTKIEIDEQLIDLQGKVDELSNSKSNKTTELGALKERIDNLLKIDEMYTLQNQRETLKAQLEIEYNEWIVNKIALAVLNKEKQAYEREKQPSVIKYSSAIFNQLTQEKYERISVSLTDKDVKIHALDGKISETEALSRGTKEQLLLALRLGFIQAYEEKNEPLPIVLDDVMVNFDNYRAQEFATILHQFSKDRQVLIFTCHKHVRDMFKKEGANILEW